MTKLCNADYQALIKFSVHRHPNGQEIHAVQTSVSEILAKGTDHFLAGNECHLILGQFKIANIAT
jgi:hypothetical protein